MKKKWQINGGGADDKKRRRAKKKKEGFLSRNGERQCLTVNIGFFLESFTIPNLITWPNDLKFEQYA